MAGNHAFSVSENFCYVGGDTPQELFERLTQFNQFPGMAEQINQFSKVTSGQASPMQQAVETVQQQMGGQVIDSYPTPPPAAPTPPAPAQSDWGQQAAAPAPTVNTAPPTCAHGPRNAVAKDWWKAWFCSGPRDMPQDQKCKPVFLPAPGKPGHNPQEWAAFPAVAK